MRKWLICWVIAASVLVFGITGTSEARGGWHHGGTRVFIGGDFLFGPWWWGPGYPYYYSSSPVVVQQSPPVYIQQAPSQPSYWYYCQNPAGYYPYVKSCPSGWLTVVPPNSAPAQ